jgi:translation initiation factor IF-2
VTDIVVLVVAADDGVMPQTVEAIQHARAAGVPILVAINKIDKPNANAERVKKDLSERDLLPEEWGGKTVFVEVSAKKLINIDQMLEMILLVADMQEIKANPNTKAMGTVIESRLDRARGPIATLLVQNGTLFERDIVVAGSFTGKIRAMYDENNRRLDLATPSTPVMVMGLEDLPNAGEKFFATDDAQKARQLSLYRQQKQREDLLKKVKTRVSLDTLFQQLQEGQIKELPLILKVDVQGSKDAIESLLNRLTTEKVKINILYSAVGAINENDVLLAAASNAIIVGFNVKPSRDAEELANREKVDIRFYNVIYLIADEIRKAMEGLLEFKSRENVTGTVEVRDIFKVPGVGTVIGGYVVDGFVRRDSHARLFRDGVQVYQGRISSLKRFKEDATEVKIGYECGISLERFNDVKAGDELQVFNIEKVRDTLDS